MNRLLQSVAMVLMTVCLVSGTWSCSENNFASTGSHAAQDDGKCKAGDKACLQKACPTNDPTCITNHTQTSTAQCLLDGAGLCTTQDPGPKQCVQGDKVNLQWTGAEKTCIVDQSKTFNFDTGECAAMKAASFTCDWPTVSAQLQQRGLLTDVLKQSAAANDKLVSCGESAAKDPSKNYHIVVQWIKLTDISQANCTADPGAHHITTGCYSIYANGATPPPPANDDEKRKQVFSCLNDL